MDDKASLIRSFFPALALGAATLAGWLFTSPRLASDRPSGESLSPSLMGGTQGLAARLWQDPIAPLGGLTHETITRQWVARLEETRDELRTAGSRACVVVAFVKNDGTVDDAESRQRTRHALLSGLAVRGYAPVDGERMGWLALPWTQPMSEAEAGPPDPGSFLSLPCEWFQRAAAHVQSDASRIDRILTLWVDERDFPKTPIARLAQIMDALGRTGQGADEFSIVVLGPRTSGGLLQMCEESTRGWQSAPMLVTAQHGKLTSAGSLLPANTIRPWQTLRGMEIYSTWASIAEGLLPPHDAQPGESRGRAALQRSFGFIPTVQGGVAPRRWANFHNLICTDSELTRALCAELQARNVPRKERDLVLLVSEWHTEYGRALPATFAANYISSKTAGTGADWLRAVHAEPGLVFRLRPADPHASRFTPLQKISYASGLDGHNPATRPVKSGDSPFREKKDATPRPGADYRAAGPSQIDYIERLAQRLRDDAGDPLYGYRVVAVGILGSDIYDKLLLLQALRPQFPDAVFFSTDLDAGFVQPRLSGRTRNLVIAASYGLDAEPAVERRLVGRLRKRLEDHANGKGPPMSEAERHQSALLVEYYQTGHSLAPFRDSHQTAIHVATKLALGRSRAGGAEDRTAVAGHAGEAALAHAKQMLSPQLFEVGRTELVELDKVMVEDNLIDWFRWKWASIGWQTPKNRTFRFLLVTTFIILLLAWPGRTLWRRSPEPLTRVVLLAAAMGVIACWVLAVLYHAFDSLVIPAGVLLAGAVGAGSRLRIKPPFAASAAYAVGLLVLLGVVYYVIGDHTFSEPFRWIEGVSLWPAEIIRALAAMLALGWLVQGQREMKAIHGKLARTFHLNDRQPDHTVGSADGRHTVSARAIWAAYLAKAGGWQPLVTMAMPAVALLFLWLYFFGLQSRTPVAPGRGAFSHVADFIILVGSGVFYTLLTLYVVQVTHVGCCAIRKLARRRTAWPQPLVSGEGARLNVDPDLLDGWLDVRFVGSLTTTLGRLTLYPFVVLLFLCASVSPIFDTWDLRRGDGIILVLVMAALPIYCAWRLSRAAEEVRAAALGELTERKLAATDQSATGVSRINQLMREVETCRAGCFRPVWEQPHVLAILIPLGGSGGIEILQRFLER